MEKRVRFNGIWLPILLVVPQFVVTAVFFFYPAGQAIWQSLFIPDPFGLSMQWVGLGNFEFLLSDPYYRASFVTTAIFWGTESLAWVIWQTDLAREAGALLGLAVGYMVKYRLDRRFVFDLRVPA